MPEDETSRLEGTQSATGENQRQSVNSTIINEVERASICSYDQRQKRDPAMYDTWNWNSKIKLVTQEMEHSGTEYLI